MLPMTFILIFYFSLQLNISTNTKLVMPQMKMLSFLDYAVYQLISDLLVATILYFNVPHFGAVKTDAIGFKTSSYLTLPQMANTIKHILHWNFVWF